MYGEGGLSGWQWLLILEALPSLIVGVIVLYYLDDDIDKARWLSIEEKTLLIKNVRAEASAKDRHSLGDAFKDGRVWLMGLIFFACGMGNYAMSFWLPSLIRSAGVEDEFRVGLLTAVPFAAGAVSMVLWGRRSDKRGERRWHLAIAMLTGAAGLALTGAFGTQIGPALMTLTLASIGIQAMAPVFWGMPTAFLTGTAAAVGIALITSLANVAGFVSPYLIGWVLDNTHSASLGLYVISATLIAGALLTVAAVPARLVNK